MSYKITLLGPSGAGKTSLVCGLQGPFAQEVLLPTVGLKRSIANINNTAWQVTEAGFGDDKSTPILCDGGFLRQADIILIMLRFTSDGKKMLEQFNFYMTAISKYPGVGDVKIMLVLSRFAGDDISAPSPDFLFNVQSSVEAIYCVDVKARLNLEGFLPAIENIVRAKAGLATSAYRVDYYPIELAKISVNVCDFKQLSEAAQAEAAAVNPSGCRSLLIVIEKNPHDWGCMHPERYQLVEAVKVSQRDAPSKALCSEELTATKDCSKTYHYRIPKRERQPRGAHLPYAYEQLHPLLAEMEEYVINPSAGEFKKQGIRELIQALKKEIAAVETKSTDSSFLAKSLLEDKAFCAGIFTHRAKDLAQRCLEALQQQGLASKSVAASP